MSDVGGDRTRRVFVRDLGLLTGAAVALGSAISAPGTDASPADLVVAGGEDPKAVVKKAIAELGGMNRFVARGDVVVIKPNMAWDRRPEQGANTNPDVVVGLIEMAFDAGAKAIKVFDCCAKEIRNHSDAYTASGIADAARTAGASVLLTGQLQAAKMLLKDGVFLKESLVWKDALECDCFINVPVAKHHGVTKVTLAMKNHMGVTADDRRQWHGNLDQALADFALAFRPRLTVLDAWRIIVRNGPRAGGLQDVQLAKKCVVGVNQANVDAYGATLFGKLPTDIRHIALAGKMGVGEIDLTRLRIREVKA